MHPKFISLKEDDDYIDKKHKSDCIRGGMCGIGSFGEVETKEKEPKKRIDVF